MLLMWDWNNSVPRNASVTKMTSRLLTWGKGDAEQRSILREKLSTWKNLDFTIGLHDD